MMCHVNIHVFPWAICINVQKGLTQDFCMFIWQVSHTGFIIYLPWAKLFYWWQIFSCLCLSWYASSHRKISLSFDADHGLECRAWTRGWFSMSWHSTRNKQITGVAQNNTSVSKRTLFFFIKTIEMSFCRAVEKPPGYPKYFQRLLIFRPN